MQKYNLNFSRGRLAQMVERALWKSSFSGNLNGNMFEPCRGPLSDAINNLHYMSDLEFQKMCLITKPTRSKNMKIKATLSMSER